MYILILSRSVPLTADEVAGLPTGCRVVDDEGEVRARIHLDLPVAGMLPIAVQMGRAVRDATFLVVGDEPAVTPAPPPPAAPVEPAAPEEPASLPAPTEPELDTTDPWALLEDGDVTGAEALFAGQALDSAGRDRVRALVHSTDPGEVALGCRIARLTEWRSFVTTMRGMLDHGDVRVRRDAVAAIGALAGPAMSPAVNRLTGDPSPEVRAAAEAALLQIEGK